MTVEAGLGAGDATGRPSALDSSLTSAEATAGRARPGPTLVYAELRAIPQRWALGEPAVRSTPRFAIPLDHLSTPTI